MQWLHRCPKGVESREHREDPIGAHVDIVTASIDVAEEAGAQAERTSSVLIDISFMGVWG